MDKIQTEMLEKGPTRIDVVKRDRRRKAAAVTLGILVGGAAAWYLGPKILGKFKAASVLSTIKVVLNGL